MMKRFKNIICIISCATLLAGIIGSAEVYADENDNANTHYLVFATDRHSSTTAIDTAMSGFDGRAEYVGLIGDMVDSESYYTSTVVSEVGAVYPGSNVNIIYGSHDSNAIDDAGVLRTASGPIFEGKGPYGNAEYYVYAISYDSMEDASTAAVDAAAFKSWVDSIKDKSIPIFVVSHMPMHAYRDDNYGGYTWSKALNYAATGSESGTVVTRDVVFLHGHNHTVDKSEYFFAPGSVVAMENGTEDVSTTIEYTYLTAGYLKANGHATQVKLTDDRISFERTDSGTLGTIKRVYTGTGKFIDVKTNKFFYEPVYWAAGKGITTGTSENTFSPNKSCSRGEFVTFLWRAAGEPEPMSTECPFTDVNQSSYYYKAVMWAYENNITTGTSADSFTPGESVSRSQTVTFLWRYMNEPAPDPQSNTFEDVQEGKYYYDAVSWALQTGVTTGTSSTTFSPNSICDRGQVVTFLCRADNIKDKYFTEPTDIQSL